MAKIHMRLMYMHDYKIYLIKEVLYFLNNIYNEGLIKCQKAFNQASFVKRSRELCSLPRKGFAVVLK